MKAKVHGASAGKLCNCGAHDADNAKAESQAKQEPRQNRNKGEQQGFLHQSCPDLRRRGADTGKDTELVNPAVHGHGKGVMDYQYQGNADKGHNCQIGGQDEPRLIVSRNADKIQG